MKQQKQDIANEKRVLTFEDLRNALIEQGVSVRRPPFLEDKAHTKFTLDKMKILPKDSEMHIDQEALDPKESLLLDGLIK